MKLLIKTTKLSALGFRFSSNVVEFHGIVCVPSAQTKQTLSGFIPCYYNAEKDNIIDEIVSRMLSHYANVDFTYRRDMYDL